jgi:hypothetical protein
MGQTDKACQYWQEASQKGEAGVRTELARVCQK